MAHHELRHTTQQPARDARVTLRPHHDQVG